MLKRRKCFDGYLPFESHQSSNKIYHSQHDSLGCFYFATSSRNKKPKLKKLDAIVNSNCKKVKKNIKVKFNLLIILGCFIKV